MMNLIQDYIEKLKKVDEQLAQAMSDRKTIEKELSNLAIQIKQQSEAFGKIVTFTFDCTFIFNQKGIFTYASISASQLLGLNPNEIIGKNWRDLNLPRDVMIPFEAHLKTVFNLGTPLSRSTRVQFPIGVRYLEYYLNPILNNHNRNVDAVVCVIRDITEQYVADTVQHQLTQEYLNEAQRLQQLIDNAPMAIIAVDKEGYITAINEAALSFLPQIRNRHFFSKSGNNSGMDTYLEETEIIARTLNGEHITAHYLQRDNQYFLINSFPTKDKQTGSILGAIIFYQDITEQEQLRKKLNWIDRINLIGEMAAGVAHEIRNPMTVVKGYMQMMSSKAEPDKVEQYTIVLEELDRINNIITDFLSLARNKTTEKSKQNLNIIVKNLYPLLHADAAKYDIEIEMDMEEDIPLLLLNEKEIIQLILNLCRNGIDAIGGKGKITIRTCCTHETVELHISDNGPGIPKEHINKIFDPFYTTKSEGTGLGLAICLSIVERHGGTIRIESEDTKGTNVLVAFPNI
jgi:PAS domain S-box-containing protein